MGLAALRSRRAPAIGLSPRGRGNPKRDMKKRQLDLNVGLSPRGRGNRGVSTDAPSIRSAQTVYPRVGGGTANGTTADRSGIRVSVYPRVGGGTPTAAALDHQSGQLLGLSPRGRRSGTGSGSRFLVLGVIACHPAGAARWTRRILAPAPGLSPRGRGNPLPVAPDCTPAL